MTGHMMGAAGAFEAFATVMSVAEQTRARHAQLPRLRPRLRPVGRRRDPATCRSATPSRTTSASAATTAPSSSSATTATEPTRPQSPRTCVGARAPDAPLRLPAMPTSGPCASCRRDRPWARSRPSATTPRPTGRNLLAGVSGAGPITSFDTTGHDVRIAAEVKDFDPTVAMDRKMARRMSRFVHFGVAAATEAVADSGIDFAT